MGNWVGSKMAAHVPDLYELSAKDIYGTVHEMREYENKVLVFVNVASKCGLTKAQYTGLVELTKKFSADDFQVLAFACSQFANQEYSKNEDIQNFIKQFDVTFPVFENIKVNGGDTHPIYQYLKYHSKEFNYGNGKLAAVGWNYGKFLVDRRGGVVKYYSPKTPPQSMEEDIASVLNGALVGNIQENPSRL